MIRLYVPIDKDRTRGYLEYRGEEHRPFEGWRPATTREWLWWEVRHARFSWIDLMFIMVIVTIARTLLG